MIGYQTIAETAAPPTPRSSSPTSVARTADYALSAGDSGKKFTNEGARELVTFTLPPTAEDLWFRFYVEDADGIRIDARDGETIRIISVVSESVWSTTIGAYVTLEAAPGGWRAVATGGTWA